MVDDLERKQEMKFEKRHSTQALIWHGGLIRKDERQSNADESERQSS